MCTNLCRRHYSITFPAEIWELLGVITKAHWSSIWCGAILNLKLQLVESGKIVAWRRPNKVRENVNKNDVS